MKGRTRGISGILMIILLLQPCFSTPLQAQDKQKFLTLNGYFSTMQSAIFDSLSGPFINDNLLHNRLNLKGYVNDHISFAAEFRNRLFTGDIVKTGPNYANSVAADNGWMDLSWNVINKPSFFFNTTIDRLYTDLTLGKFEARVGRQRINWGQALVWNPNDIFNAYSYFDFDYVERPGSDAIRLQYYAGYSTTAEIAIKSDYLDRITMAALYRFNKGGFDIQFLGGYFNSEDIVAGTGWSGALGSFSFRGEATWFQPAKSTSATSGTGIFTAGFDRSFKDNSIAQFQVMYCNNPFGMGSFTSLYNATMTTKELAFSKFTAFGSFTYPLTPLFNLTFSTMWFPDLKGYFLGPSLDYSLAENVDFSLYWQHFDGNLSGVSQRINMGFLRVKYSF
jgi:hypothetical protein